MAGEASGTLLAVSGSWPLELCHNAWKSKRTRSVSRGFPSGSKTPAIPYRHGKDQAGGKLALRLWSASAIHEEFQRLVMHLNQLACRTTNKAGTGRRTMQTKRYW